MLETPNFDPGGSISVRTIQFLRSNYGRPLVDREGLRRAVVALASSNRSRVLIVDGPSGSGKSYSLEFINYVSHITGAFSVAWVDLKNDANYSRFGPSALIRTIALQTGLDMGAIPRQTSAGPRWVIELTNWLFNRLDSSTSPWWIVLDGVNQVYLPPETLDLITRLVLRAESQPTTLRIVLLGFDIESLPIRTSLYVLREDIPHVQKTDIESFYRAVFDARGEDVDSEAVGVLADSVIDRIPPDGPQRMRAMSTEIEESMDFLLHFEQSEDE